MDLVSDYEASNLSTEYCATEFNRRLKKANCLHVRPFDSMAARFEVVTGVNNAVNKGGNSQVVHLNVDDRSRRCTCENFQGTVIPCSHAIACCQFLGMEAKVFINPHAALRECYKSGFEPLGDMRYWPKYHGPYLHVASFYAMRWIDAMEGFLPSAAFVIKLDTMQRPIQIKVRLNPNHHRP
ncbi:unnamed protein product [Linum trigynum]|uniref:SWIM-type domain-containing protein n=1 Tax=Linum trigynum TaxID=586398 RepID=A0AAV2GKY3_9ROSI